MPDTPRIAPPATILRSHREWLATVQDLHESDLPCNVSTVAFAIEVASRAVAAYDVLLAVVDDLISGEAHQREAS